MGNRFVLPFLRYAQAAEKHWKLVHHIHDTHDKGNDGKEDDHLPTVATAARNSPAAPYETSPDQPLQVVSAKCFLALAVPDVDL